MATATVQQVLSSHDEVQAAELLFTLLSEQAQGRDLSSVAAEVAQGVLKGRWSLHIKRLAYDLCKAVQMSDSDSGYVISGVKMDIQSADPNLVTLALDMLTHLPPHLLASLLSSGELAHLFNQPLSADRPTIRAAAVNTLGHILLVPDVVNAASGSAGMANTVNEHWQTLTDALVDEDEGVVAAAVAVTVALLQAGLAADVRVPEGYLVERLSAICAARVTSALGGVMSAFANVTLQARVDTLRLLTLLVEHAARSRQWKAEDVGGMAGLPSGTILPGLASLAPVVWGYCSDLLRNGDAAVRLEAARAVLRVAAVTSQPQPQLQPGATQLTDPSSDGGVGCTPGSVPQPTGLLLLAVSALLELEDSVPLVEAAAEDVLSVVADGLQALPRRDRSGVLVQLWAGLGRLKNTPARMELCARAWASVVQEDDPAALSTPDGAAAQLSALLGEAYISNVLAGKPTTLPLLSRMQLMNSGGGAPVTLPTIGSQGSLQRTNSVGGAATAPASATGPNVTAAASTDDLTAHAPAAHGSKVPAAREKSKGGLFKFKTFKDKAPKDKAYKDDSVHSNTPPMAPPAAVPADKRSVVSTLSQAADQAMTAVQEFTLTPQDSYKPTPITVSGAHRHEIASTLLAVVHTCHPASQLAWQLCADVSHTVMHDQAPSAALLNKYTSWHQQRILSWISAAHAALQATSGCMTWEPSVVPAITPNQSAATAEKPLADFNTTVQDLWLQLLQAATYAARAVHALSKPVAALTGAVVPPAPLEAQQSLQSDVSTVVGTPQAQAPLATMPSVGSTAVTQTPTAAGAAVQAVLNPMGQAADNFMRELVTLSKHVLREWASLSRALRPRALWAIGHSVDMAPHADELWEHGLKALQDVLCKLGISGNVARVADMMTSAAQGALFKSGRIGWPRDRPFVFDVVAASALCERADYDSQALFVGLTVAQDWTLRLQDALGSCAAEASKRVMSDAVFQAARLEAVLREFMASADVQSNPLLREWGKRTMRALASTAVFVHPAARALEEAEAAAKAARDAAERHEKAAGENGYDPHATIHSSSSSEAGDVASYLPVSLPTAMYLPPGVSRVRPAMPPPQPVMPQPVFAPAASEQLTDNAVSFAVGHLAHPGSPGGATPGARDAENFKARAAMLHGPGPAHMVPSSSTTHPWGYPFATAPRPCTLFYSKRSRRARLLRGHVRKALLRCGFDTETPSSDLTHALALPSHSVLRLDDPAFWALLKDDGVGTGGGRPITYRIETVELCGPGDPVMVLGTLTHHPTDATQLVLRITAHNRTDLEVRGAVLQILAQGPVRIDRRAAHLTLPRVAPRDKVTHTFSLKLLGYGMIQLSSRLQLAHATTSAVNINPVTLPCKPLRVGLVQHLMLPPTAGTPAAQDFFASWTSLPVRLELTAACVWPGREGAAATLSGMLLSPLACVLLSYVSTSASYQLALAGETSTGEEVLILVHTQLLPPPTNLSTYVKASASDDTTKAKDTKDEASKAGPSGDKAPNKGTAADASLQGTARLPHALLSISVRTTLPDVGVTLSGHSAEFIRDLTSRSAVPLCEHLAAPERGACDGAPRPPLHPRIQALHAAHTQSLRALPSATSGLLGAGAHALLDVHAQGSKARSKVSHKFLSAAAQAEWQRLAAQPV